MDRAIFDKLAQLPRLSPSNRQAVSCKICGNPAHFFDVVDFNKTCSMPEIYPFGVSGITVPYHRCGVCKFLFTEFFDPWSPADFSRFIYNEDYIKVDGEYADIRPRREAVAMAERLAGQAQLRILDYGSGSGVFAEHLRSFGFNHVSSYDPFSNPDRPEGRFDVITCFEVLEHTTDPRAVLSEIASFLASGGCVIFGTGIQPPEIGEVRANWWYVAPRNGHVSIFSLNSLLRLGQKVGLVLHAGSGGTAFAGSAVSPASRAILSNFASPTRLFQLTAPNPAETPPAEQRNSWHGVERIGAVRFRWTRESSIAWRLQDAPLQPGELTVEIPFLNEIQPGFASQCRVAIGSQSAALICDGGVLTASFELDQPVDPVVSLTTPPPLRPCDLRDTGDARELGLAIAVGFQPNG